MNKKGFTLIEILVACSILLIALSSFNLAFRISSRLLVSGQQRIAAMHELRGEAELLQGISFDTLPSLDGQTFASGKGKLAVNHRPPDLLWIDLAIGAQRITTLRCR